MSLLNEVLELFDLGRERRDDEDDPAWVRRDRARLLEEYDRREANGTLGGFKGTG